MTDPRQGEEDQSAVPALAAMQRFGRGAAGLPESALEFRSVSGNAARNTRIEGGPKSWKPQLLVSARLCATGPLL
jgi:hypothetical protein